MPAADKFEGHTSVLTSPINDGFNILPNDGADLSTVTRGLMVATGGDLAVVFKGGGTVTLPGLEPGVIYPFRVRRVLVAGTGATGIVGLY